MRFHRLSSLVAVPLLAVAVVHGDEVVLKQGGRVHGKIIEASSVGYLVELSSGGRIRIPKPAVRKLIRPTDLDRDYQIRERQTLDSADGHWQLAEWCRRSGLLERRERHLKRVIALATDHVKARHALGYSQVGGRWVTQDNYRRGEGYVRFEGRWMLPQEIELFKKTRARQSAENAWRGKLKRMRSSLLSETTRSFQRRKELQNRLSTIRDPVAVKALAQYLEKENYRQLKFYYIQSLALINTSEALQVLVQRSMLDPDEEVFYECLDHLVKQKTPALVRAYIKYLKSQNNVVINRAAITLGRLEDSEAFGPLIDSLVTTHFFLLKPAGNSSPDSITSSFVNPGSNPNSSTVSPPLGGGGMTAGNRTKVIPRRAQNSEVLSALVKLSSGMNFGYNQIAWRNWDSARIRRVEASKTLRK